MKHSLYFSLVRVVPSDEPDAVVGSAGQENMHPMLVAILVAREVGRRIVVAFVVPWRDGHLRSTRPIATSEVVVAGAAVVIVRRRVSEAGPSCCRC